MKNCWWLKNKSLVPVGLNCKCQFILLLRKAMHVITIVVLQESSLYLTSISMTYIKYSIKTLIHHKHNVCLHRKLHLKQCYCSAKYINTADKDTHDASFWSENPFILCDNNLLCLSNIYLSSPAQFDPGRQRESFREVSQYPSYYTPF